MQKNIVPTRKRPYQHSLSARLKENEKQQKKKNTTKQNKKTKEKKKKQ